MVPALARKKEQQAKQVKINSNLSSNTPTETPTKSNEDETGIRTQKISQNTIFTPGLYSEVKLNFLFFFVYTYY